MMSFERVLLVILASHILSVKFLEVDGLKCLSYLIIMIMAVTLCDEAMDFIIERRLGKDDSLVRFSSLFSSTGAQISVALASLKVYGVIAILMVLPCLLFILMDIVTARRLWREDVRNYLAD